MVVKADATRPKTRTCRPMKPRFEVRGAGFEEEALSGSYFSPSTFHLLVRPNGLAEILQLAQRDETQAMESHAIELEVLDVTVDGVLVVLFQSTVGNPFLQVVGGPCVLVGLAVVGICSLTLRDASDVVFAPSVEFFPLGVADDIIGRRNALAHVSNDAGIKPECSERLYFHGHNRHCAAVIRFPFGVRHGGRPEVHVKRNPHPYSEVPNTFPQCSKSVEGGSYRSRGRLSSRNARDVNPPWSVLQKRHIRAGEPMQ